MATRAENELLTRVGAGTPLGETMRRYWHPVCLVEQVEKPGGKPVRVTLLGEKLVVFRSLEGKVGVMGEFCAHRRASLALGRIEECGIRCIYHGWLFGTDGKLLDVMNHNDPAYLDRVRQPAYPVVEAGGIVWSYLGPADKQPEFPRFPFVDMPETHRFAYLVNAPCNYLQNLEAGLDSSHVGILHANQARPNWNNEELNGIDAHDDTVPRFEIEETDFGYHYASIRTSKIPGTPQNVRIVPFIMPYTRIIPGRKGGFNGTFAFEVPSDDTHTATFLVVFDAERPVDPNEVRRNRGIDDTRFYDPETRSMKLDWSNNLGQDRDSMDTSWSGLRGIRLEDAAMSMSMHPISDRENENLVPADAAVVKVRRRIKESIDRVARGEEPLGLSSNAAGVSAIDEDLPTTEHWRVLVPGHKTTEGSVTQRATASVEG